jgi:hypothetical protein
MACLRVATKTGTVIEERSRFVAERSMTDPRHSPPSVSTSPTVNHSGKPWEVWTVLHDSMVPNDSGEGLHRTISRDDVSYHHK